MEPNSTSRNIDHGHLQQEVRLPPGKSPTGSPHPKAQNGISELATAWQSLEIVSDDYMNTIPILH